MSARGQTNLRRFITVTFTELLCKTRLGTAVTSLNLRNTTRRKANYKISQIDIAINVKVKQSRTM